MKRQKLAIIINRRFFYLLALLNLFPGGLCAETLEIPSSFNPVGSGARALGMGGAFIAIADDATAASWNPGGLIQLETPEISVVGSALIRKENLSFGTNPEASGKEGISQQNFNYISAVYPFQIKGYNMIVSLNHQHLYNLSREWQFPLHFTDDSSVINESININQSGGLSALGFTYCVQLTPDISIGTTLNTWENILGSNGWEASYSLISSGVVNGLNVSSEFYVKENVSFSGYNANIGLLWRLNGKWTMGLVYKTSFEADLGYHYKNESASIAAGWPTMVNSFIINEDYELTMPRSYGIGFAYRFSDNLTTSFDLYTTDWSNFVLRKPTGDEFSPISGKLLKESDIDPTYQIRLGAEYLLIGDKYTIPMRSGLFYDPAPAEGHPDNYFGFSLGTGIAYKAVTLDLAYQFRYGNDVGSSLMQTMNFSQDTQEHTVYLSTIYHF